MEDQQLSAACAMLLEEPAVGEGAFGSCPRVTLPEVDEDDLDADLVEE